MKDVRNILVTTDFSETSKKAIEPARTLATNFGARITLVHVEENHIPPMVLEYMAESLEEVRKHQHEYARRQLDAFAREYLAGLSVDTVVAVGVPHVEIVEVARSHSADMIVIATHGRGFISHAILGSTAERVVRRAECPVLVVRG